MTTRTEDIKEIRNLLKKITGRTWSVSGSTGTAYSYIRIKTQPRRLEETGEISREVNLIDQWLLGMVFNDGRPVHFQGHQITPEGRDRFIDFLRHLIFKGYTCNTEKAQAKLDESTKKAEYTAEALISDEVRKAGGTPIETWRLEQIAQHVAHRHTILQTTADQITATALERVTNQNDTPAETEMDCPTHGRTLHVLVGFNWTCKSCQSGEIDQNAAAWLALAESF